MLEDARFFIAGKFTSRGVWIHPSATLAETELIVVTRGCVKIEENGIRYELHPGDALFLDPCVRHAGYEKTVENVSFYWLHFTGTDIDGIAGIKKHLTLTDPAIVSMLCQNLLHFSGTGADNSVSDRLLYVLLYEIRRQSAEDSDDVRLTRRLQEWLRLNLPNNPTPAEAAATFGYSEGYLSALCKKSFGFGLKRLINEQRIAHVKGMLLESGKTTAEIAAACGFSSSTLFIKYFKYHTGMTPNAFRTAYYAIYTNNE